MKDKIMVSLTGRINILFGKSFSAVDASSVDDFPLLDVIMNIYIHRYIYGFNTDFFIRVDEEVINGYFTTADSNKNILVPRYLSSNKNTYLSIVKTMSILNLSFSEIWSTLAAKITRVTDVSELDTVNAMFSSERRTLVMIYDHLLRLLRGGKKEYKSVELDTIHKENVL